MAIPADQTSAREDIWPVNQNGTPEESIIPPEIAGDSFAACLKHLCQTEELTNVLEIGSSSGAGSTAAIVEGLVQNPGQPRLFCLEMVRARYRALVERFAQNPDFHVSHESIP